MHVSCTRRTLGGAQFCIALERLCLMVFRLPRGGGQSCSKHALRVLRPVLSSLFCPLCGVLLRFFARALRGADALKPARGAASRAAGCARLCGCALRLAQRRAGSHQAPVRAQVGRQSWWTACVLMPDGIHPQLNHAEAQCDLCSCGAAGTWRASALFKEACSINL